MRSILIGFLLGSAALAAASSASAQGPDPLFFHRMSTQFRGTDMSLDVFNGGPKNNMTHLASFQDVSGQFWKFSPTGDGRFRITSMFRGPGMCLDIFNGGPDNDEPHLVPCANVSGQFWSIRTEGAFARLTTQFRGPGMCLDIFNGGPKNNQPHLAPCANVSGQLWLLSKTEKRAPVD
jgi:ricin-type beta-trefoil lectin protein